ncbi:hypothetical protein SOVF_126020, partial [Spinacia oleracea]
YVAGIIGTSDPVSSQKTLMLKKFQKKDRGSKNCSQNQDIQFFALSLEASI